MIKIIISFITGLIVAAVMVGAVGRYIIYPAVAREKEEFGRNQGYASGQIDFAAKIPAALGSDFSKNEKYIIFHQVKDVDVIVVERNGVKTLRVYPNQ
jgi:hypothetical protein